MKKIVAAGLVTAVGLLILSGCSGDQPGVDYPNLVTGEYGAIRTIKVPMQSGKSVECVVVYTKSTGANSISCDWDNAK